MAGDADIQSLNRTLKEMNQNLKTMTRIMETVNTNLVALGKRLPKIEEKADA